MISYRFCGPKLLLAPRLSSDSRVKMFSNNQQDVFVHETKRIIWSVILDEEESVDDRTTAFCPSFIAFSVSIDAMVKTSAINARKPNAPTTNGTTSGLS